LKGEDCGESPGLQLPKTCVDPQGPCVDCAEFDRAGLYCLRKNAVLYQGTTLVVPQMSNINAGFSPCGAFWGKFARNLAILESFGLLKLHGVISRFNSRAKPLPCDPVHIGPIALIVSISKVRIPEFAFVFILKFSGNCPGI
jgi:hypothetical protein